MLAVLSLLIAEADRIATQATIWRLSLVGE